MIAKRFLFSFFISAVCLVAVAQNETAISSTTSFKQKDTAYWVDNFRQLRDALYKKDKQKAKAFFSFPVNEGNEIWYVVYSGNDKAVALLGDKEKPFTEKDFDKYFDKLFSKPFIKCLLKIKADELYKKGESESPELKDSTTTYKLYSTYNKEDNTIMLNFSITTFYKTEDGEGKGESNVVYYFSILQNGHIKFKELRIAG